MGKPEAGDASRFRMVATAHGALRNQAIGLRRVFSGSTLAKGALLALMVQVATGVVRYLIQILFARWGGPVEYGKYAFAFGWTQILIIPATLGLTLSVLRFVPQYMEEKRWGLLRGLFRRSVEVTLISGAVFSAAAIAVVLAVGGADFRDTLLIGVSLITLVGLVTVLREAMRGTQRVVLAYGIGDLLPMGATLVVAGFLFAGSPHLSGVQMLLATGGGFLVALVVQSLVLRPAIPAAFASGIQPSFELRTWVMLSLPLWFVTMFTLIINQSDLLVVGALKTPHEVGIYAAGSKTAFLGSYVLTAVSAVLAPMIVRHHSSADFEALRGTIGSAIHLIFWPSLVICGVLFIWPSIVLAAFGHEFAGASSIVRILVVGQFVNSITGPAGYVLLLTGSQRRVAQVYGTAALVEVLMLLALVPPFGAHGAAIATATTVSVSNCVLYGFARRWLRGATSEATPA